MRVLVRYADPVEAGYRAALQRAVIETLAEPGHEVEGRDLQRREMERFG